jgi:hypothetical protein
MQSNSVRQALKAGKLQLGMNFGQLRSAHGGFDQACKCLSICVERAFSRVLSGCAVIFPGTRGSPGFGMSEDALPWLRQRYRVTLEKGRRKGQRQF